MSKRRLLNYKKQQKISELARKISLANSFGEINKIEKVEKEEKITTKI